MVKILIIDGSPRMRGNTAVLSAEIGRGILEAKAEFEIVKLQKLTIKPCLGCEVCQKKKNLRCIQEDDMNSLFPRLLEAGAIILASPIYWFSVTAQMKAFIDRLYALNNGGDNALGGKKMAAVLVYGDEDPYSAGAVNAIGSLKDLFKWIKTKDNTIIYGTAYEAGVVKTNSSFMKKAYNLGKNIASKQ
jgi:multimeric flavodoxin WrbA